ncbi:hypothetical protein SRM_p61005 (plasmid) [Salinibacter ruber M8]|uniref:Uncharacterized protein n=1 Tax=Salinibacter ruber (strain M8) TaxID=761659 RepID=D5H4C1_SALRM|nr:hypothetical protein SRM_p61005 [Salinibacter ruber M8]
MKFPQRGSVPSLTCRLQLGHRFRQRCDFCASEHVCETEHDLARRSRKQDTPANVLENADGRTGFLSCLQC